MSGAILSSPMSIGRAPCARKGRTRPSLPFLILGALLALLALVNIIGLSGWHSALVGHDDQIVMTDIIEHDDSEPSMPEVDLHKTTHAVIHGMTDADSGVAPVASFFFPAIIWSLPMDMSRRGIAPEGLLRPPRM